MNDDGRNPMRWDCHEGPDAQCFNKIKRPKIEEFCDCFPGRISFGDVDGIVEIESRALLLEWKPQPQQLSRGQRVMYEHLSANGMFTAMCLAGDPREMRVTHHRFFYFGHDRGWKPSSLEKAKDLVRCWVKEVQGRAEWVRDYEKHDPRPPASADL